MRKSKSWMIGTETLEGDKVSGMFKVAYGADWEQLHHGANADSLHSHSQLKAADGTPVLRTDNSGTILVDRGDEHIRDTGIPEGWPGGLPGSHAAQCQDSLE
ncbi:hypothetical protein ACFTAO_27605 [Paenibacillus rhizoplanae]